MAPHTQGMSKRTVVRIVVVPVADSSYSEPAYRGEIRSAKTGRLLGRSTIARCESDAAHKAAVVCDLRGYIGAAQ